MADTYSRIYVHIVFAVRNRSASILPAWEDELYGYITGIIREKNQKPLGVNGMPDHVHILIGMRPTYCLSDLVREIKKSSTNFVNARGFNARHFQWQNGFGAFTCGHSDLNRVITYIKQQKKHHSEKSFKNEYYEYLNENEIDFKDEFLFDWTDR